MPGFWDRPTESAGLMQKRRAVERRVETLRKLRIDEEELATWRELLGDAGDADPDALAFLARLGPEVDALDLHLKLAGPDDDKNAIVAINSGAGGTESQDWAEMLLRMYVRWAERKGFELELIDRQDGEEAGIKNATVAVRGTYAYGLLHGRGGRAPPGADQSLRRAGAPPHLVRLGRRAARDRRLDRDRHPGQGPAGRHLPCVGRRRPARQQDRVGGAHHPPADRHRRAAARTSAASTRTAPRR